MHHPCTDPCSAQLACHHGPNLTPPTQGVTATHDTAAVQKGHKIKPEKANGDYSGYFFTTATFQSHENLDVLYFYKINY